MRMTPPAFWYDQDDVAAKAKAASLSAFSALYVIGHMLHQNIARPAISPVPVICIGNLVVGGGGKTPAALAVMALLRRENLFQNPCFLSRGYGGTLQGPVLVDPSLHKAAETGDEPLLLAQSAPAIVSADRVRGARFAAAQGHDVIVMDDGLQNPSLQKNLSLLVIDGASGFGNGHLLPAGPLRTPVGAGMKKCDAVLLIGEDKTGILRHVPKGKPVLHATLSPVSLLDTIPDYIAFCGIARPEKFWQTLEQAELKVAEFHQFPDHHPYAAADLDLLRERAAALEATLVTTAKDAARLPDKFLEAEGINVMVVELTWAPGDDKTLTDLIKTTCRT